MAFEIIDWHKQYAKKGKDRGIFNVAHSDENSTEGATRYYAYQNEAGAFFIQKVVTNGSLVIKAYTYYARTDPASLAQNWIDRATLTYVDFYLLFHQGA